MTYIQIFFLTIFLLSNCSLNSTQKRVTESKNVSLDSESSLIIDEYSIIQPGLPGQESKRIDALMATDIAGASFVKADVDFLQGVPRGAIAAPKTLGSVLEVTLRPRN